MEKKTIIDDMTQVKIKFKRKIRFVVVNPHCIASYTSSKFPVIFSIFIVSDVVTQWFFV